MGNTCGGCGNADTRLTEQSMHPEGLDAFLNKLTLTQNDDVGATPAVHLKPLTKVYQGASKKSLFSDDIISSFVRDGGHVGGDPGGTGYFSNPQPLSVAEPVSCVNVVETEEHKEEDEDDFYDNAG